MSGFDDRREQQRRAAARRVAEHAGDRAAHIEALQGPGGLAAADTPARIAKRVDRLRGYGVRAPALAGAPESAPVLEAIVNTTDFVDVRYLEAGVAAARAVGRVNIRGAGGRVEGYGSGSLVSSVLLLTNHHVLPDAAVARASEIEFNYQDGIDGRPLQPVTLAFDPDAFFLADEERDFALVAVQGGESALAQFGFNPLIEAEGKAIIGEFVTIVQHPRGEKKQVSLRENRLVDLLAAYLHYEADTEPGSSGSPVFNDQWEVVALHHASVPSPEHGELGGVMNEGIRVSRILAFVRDHELPPAQRALADRLWAPGVVQLPPAGTGTGNGHAELGPAEAIVIDPDYGDRRGYDAGFLRHPVPLPALSAEQVPKAAINDLATAEPRYVLPYHNFSVVVNAERGLAFFTAVNIDGKLSQKLKRETDRWVLDPRIPASQQTDNTVYADNDLDRGHLVRRLDPAWAATRELAKLANDDTFHYTNCTPQHKDFNQGQTLWAGLEDYILEHAETSDLKVSVFTGPVLADDDDSYRGVKLPRQFWKVVAIVKESGELSATAYLLSQEQLIHGFGIEEFSYGEYRTYQVPVRRIEELTGLSLGALPAADPLERLEAAVPAREVASPAEIVL